MPLQSLKLYSSLGQFWILWSILKNQWWKRTPPEPTAPAIKMIWQGQILRFSQSRLFKRPHSRFRDLVSISSLSRRETRFVKNITDSHFQWRQCRQRLWEYWGCGFTQFERETWQLYSTLLIADFNCIFLQGVLMLLQLSGGRQLSVLFRDDFVVSVVAAWLSLFRRVGACFCASNISRVHCLDPHVMWCKCCDIRIIIFKMACKPQLIKLAVFEGFCLLLKVK